MVQLDRLVKQADLGHLDFLAPLEKKALLVSLVQLETLDSLGAEVSLDRQDLLDHQATRVRLVSLEPLGPKVC